jgi:predicted alpha/beta-hydrolase family hydrolase
MTETPEIRLDGPADGPTLALAHGAGVGMDSPFMAAFAEGLAARGVRVARFEFPYMAQRRVDGKKRPPSAQAKLLASFRAVVEALGGPQHVAVGGKSMGGRMASLLAAEVEAEGTAVPAVLALGYPFHPPGKPDSLRIAHLQTLRTPMLVCQGTRDPFGTADEVPGYRLPDTIRLHWAPDGDHDLSPRKRSGHTTEANWAAAMDAAAQTLTQAARPDAAP